MKKPQWVPDAEATNCSRCNTGFSTFMRRHHCRRCGNIFCRQCSTKKIILTELGYSGEERVCDCCFEITTLFQLNKDNTKYNEVAQIITKIAQEEINHKKIQEQGVLGVTYQLVNSLNVEILEIVSQAFIAFSKSNILARTLASEGMAPLMKLLASQNEKVQINACKSIEELANNEKIRSIIFPHVIQPLLQAFDGSVNRPDVSLATSRALLELSPHERFVEEGGSVPFITLALSEDSEVQRISSKSFLIICSSKENQVTFMNSGGLLPLISLLTSQNDEVLENAVVTLYNLAENVDNRSKIVRVGGLQPLIDLIGRKEGNVQLLQLVLMALSRLACAKTRDTMGKYKGLVEGLMKLAHRSESEVLLPVLDTMSALASCEDMRKMIRKSQFLDTLQPLTLSGDSNIKATASSLMAQLE